MKRLLGSLVTLLTLVALAGCGSSSGGGKGDADPAAAMPANASVYLEAVVRPEGNQRDRVLAFAGKVLRTDDPSGKIRALVDKALSSDSKSSFKKDVEPWLGRRAGLYLTDLQNDSATAVVALAAKDTGKASDALKAEAARNSATKSTYNGVTIYDDRDDETSAAQAGDYVLFAEKAADLHAAIDTVKGKPSLAGSDRFKSATDGLPEDRMGLMYFDFQALLGAIAAQAAQEDPTAGAMFGALGLSGLGGAAAALLVDEDRASIEVRTPKPKEGSTAGSLASKLGIGGSSELVREAPDGSFLVVGVPELGKTAKTLVTTLAGAFGGAAVTQQFEQESGLNLDNDVFGWIGDVALFARGGDAASLDGGVMIKVTDPAKAKAALPKIVGFVRQGGGIPLKPVQVEGADIAFKADTPQSPKPIVVALSDDRAVVAAGTEAAGAALRGDDTIEDGGLWGRAKDTIDGLDPSVIIDGQGIVKLVTLAAGDAPDVASAKPYLDLLDVFAAGSKTEGDHVRTRAAVKLR